MVSGAGAGGGGMWSGEWRQVSRSGEVGILCGGGKPSVIYPWVSSGCRSSDREKGSAFMLFDAWIRMQNCRPR